MFENIKAKLEEEYKINLTFYKDKVQTEEGLKNLLMQERKQYKKDPQIKIIKFMTSYLNKKLNKELNFLKIIEDAQEFKSSFIITIEWVKSKTWGSNPIVYTNYGYKEGGISGCGYCKTSTATATGLNSHLPILKLLCLKEEERLNKLKLENRNENINNYDELSRRNYIGYGSGYGIIPSFEGGVGVSSHETILSKLGLKMENVTSTNNTDVYIITKDYKKEDEQLLKEFEQYKKALNEKKEDYDYNLKVEDLNNGLNEQVKQ